MTEHIKIYNPGTPAYDRLLTAAALMTERSPLGRKYYVGVTYFDFGQNWEWTTILCDGGNFGGYQALNPVDHEAIVCAETVEAIGKAVDAVFANKFCPDRIKEDRVEKINKANARGLCSMYNF